MATTPDRSGTSPVSSQDRLSEQRESQHRSMKFGEENQSTSKSYSDGVNGQNETTESAFRLVNIDLDDNLHEKSGFSNDLGLDSSRDELDILSPRSSVGVSGYSVPDLTSGLMSSSHHRRHAALHRPHRDFRKTGASLPTSRTASPDADQILRGNRRKAASADISKYLVEKEVLESQLRKMQVENSTLQTENKLLKEKHNRGQSRINQLESQLRGVQRDAITLNTEMTDEMSALTQRTRDRKDRDLQDLQYRVTDLTAQLDTLRLENASLRNQLDSTRLSADITSTSNSSERSKIIESFKVENFTLKDELRQVRRLLEECERARENEAARRQESSAQVVRLTEMKALLQQELEQAGGGSVAQRQVKSLERRLQITEERLHQERADRANKLTATEEKLINDNARLQVAEKELKRQLTREREKHRNIEQKFKDMRDDNERLRTHITETNSLTDNSGLIKLRTGQKKVIRDERGLFEDRIARYKDTLEDVTKEKEQLDNILRGKIKDLTQAHHDAVANARNIEDKNAAIMAENESLRCSLRCSSPLSTSGIRDLNISSAEAEVESLRSRLRTAEEDGAQRSRTERVLEAELGSLRPRLAAKDAALEEALAEIDRLHGGHLDGGDLLDVKQQQIDKLTVEVRGLQEEVRLWREKVNTAHADRSQLEREVEQLTTSRARSKFTDQSKPNMAESDKLALETELHEKDNQVLQLSIKYNECENELQRTERQLATSEQHAKQLDAQLDQLQAQLRQKTRMLERVSSTESDHATQIKALRENLNTANHDLTEKTAKMRQLQLEQDQLHDRLHRIEGPGHALGTTGDSTLDTHQRLLEYERENARRDLDRANTAMNLLIQENAELLNRVRGLHQELVAERAQLCQVTTEKVEAQQQLHLCQDDRDTLDAQRERLLSDMTRLSSENQTDILQLHGQALGSKVNYELKYPSLNADGKTLAIELGTVHRLLEAREREVQMLRNTIERQKVEIQSHTGKLQLLQEEHLNNRDDIERLTNQLTHTMKENSVAVEASHSLATEKTRLQMEKLQLEKDVGQGGSEMERRITEIQELTRKFEKAESQSRDAERQLHLRETALVALETELKHLTRNNNALEMERTHHKGQIDRLNEDVRSLRNTVSTLEKQLNQERSSLADERTSRELKSQELDAALKQLESLRHETDSVRDTEHRNLHNLQSTLHQEEEKVGSLEDSVKTQRLELETLRAHLSENRNTIDQYKKDKQTLYQDVQELCRKLADKDETIMRLQEKCNDAVDHLQKDFITEKTYMTKEREKLELDLAKTKEEMEELQERMKRKELQLEAYVRTNQDLEMERRARQDSESQVARLETELVEARRTFNTLHLDSTRKADQSKHTQESLEKAHHQVSHLKESHKAQREQLSSEVTELRLHLTETTHRHETEKSDLQDRLNRALSDLRAREASLTSVSETRESLYESQRGLEKTVEGLRNQLHEEITARKLAEQKNESLKGQLDDIKAKRVSLDDRYVELQATLAKVEAERNLERDKYRRLKQEVSDERSTSSNAEAHAQVLHTQVLELQAELSSLRTQLESQKQNLVGKNKRLALDMKQQLENFDKERSKLVLQSQQLSTDLESVREQVASKNREQLRLQEDVLSVGEQLRESTTKNKHLTEALRIEEQLREKLELRTQELELKQKFKTDVDSESSRMDATRAEVSKMMADMQKKMKDQMEQNKNVDKEAAARQQKQLEDFKKKVAGLDSALNQEQAMHMVTRTQLSSLDEDNHRLRQQLQAARKRTSPASDDKSKSRMEEINEIIARSQTRAQQMLASGVYSDDPLRSSGRDLLSPIPFIPAHLNTSILSDCNRSMASDDLSRDISKDLSASPDTGIFRTSNANKRP